MIADIRPLVNTAREERRQRYGVELGYACLDPFCGETHRWHWVSKFHGWLHKKQLWKAILQ